MGNGDGTRLRSCLSYYGYCRLDELMGVEHDDLHTMTGTRATNAHRRTRARQMVNEDSTKAKFDQILRMNPAFAAVEGAWIGEVRRSGSSLPLSSLVPALPPQPIRPLAITPTTSLPYPLHVPLTSTPTQAEPPLSPPPSQVTIFTPSHTCQIPGESLPQFQARVYH
jgi:hypothetical protein